MYTMIRWGFLFLILDSYGVMAETLFWEFIIKVLFLSFSYSLLSWNSFTPLNWVIPEITTIFTSLSKWQFPCPSLNKYKKKGNGNHLLKIMHYNDRKDEPEINNLNLLVNKIITVEFLGPHINIF